MFLKDVSTPFFVAKKNQRYPLLCSLAGVLAGLFGVGGGCGWIGKGRETMGICGKSWENHEKILEIQRKTMNKSLENHEKLWKIPMKMVIEMRR